MYSDEYLKARRQRVNTPNNDDLYVLWTKDDILNSSNPVSFPFIWVIIISIIVVITVSHRGRL